MNKDSRVFVAGHNGLVGSAILRELKSQGYRNILIAERSEIDLELPEDVNFFFKNSKPEYVFMAAARVGGILDNSRHPVDFLLKNLRIQNNVIEQSHLNEVNKLIFLGSSCIYPKQSTVPIKESSLLGGFLEPTNESYAIAKIAGIKLCQSYKSQYSRDFISAIPCNIYGHFDTHAPERAHVITALRYKFNEALRTNGRIIEVWGTGSPLREFLHCDDLAKALILLMKKETKDDIYNIGSGNEISIRELVLLMSDILGYKGSFKFNHDFPDGTYTKLIDSSRIRALGWEPLIEFKSGLRAILVEEQMKVL